MLNRLPTVVLLHAHPDDEAIFTGLLTHRLVTAGSRVVLVTATGGEAGVPRVPLPRGESLRDRRTAELERACELLGIAALHVLPFSDSGAHRGPWAAGTLGAAALQAVVDRVGRVVEAEDAGAIVHYDPRGIYGHVDHVRVHQAGAAVARRLGIAAYEATVDADALRRGPRHVLQQAAGESLDVGVPSGGIGLTVHARPQELLAKMAAMAAHSSQIGPEYLDAAAFAGAYGREWFVRRGAPSVLDGVLSDTRQEAAVRRRRAELAGTAA